MFLCGLKFSAPWINTIGYNCYMVSVFNFLCFYFRVKVLNSLYFVAQGDFKLVEILLFQPTECWDYVCTSMRRVWLVLWEITSLPKLSQHFTFPQAVNVSFCCYHCSPCQNLWWYCSEFAQSNRYVVVFHYFNFHCPGSIFLYAYHLSIFFNEVLIKVFDSLLNQVALLSCWILRVPWVLDDSSLSGMSLADIFSQSMACLFILWHCLLRSRNFKF